MNEESNSILEVGKPSGSNRIIKPTKFKKKETFYSKVNLNELGNHANLLRLCAISGRNLSTLGILQGGDVAWGNLNLINADTNEQITVYPEGIVPDGLWVPANHLPEVYLRSI